MRPDVLYRTENTRRDVEGQVYAERPALLFYALRTASIDSTVYSTDLEVDRICAEIKSGSTTL